MPKKSLATDSKEPERLIYVGPSIPGGILQQYTVYKGGMPVHINGLVDKCPVLKQLFVPVDNMAGFVQAASQKGTRENIFYQQAIDFIKTGGIK